MSWCFDDSLWVKKHCNTESKWCRFQPMYRYFKGIAGVINGDYIQSWKSKLLSEENITAPSAPNNFLNFALENLVTKPRVRFSGSCLKQNALHTITENQ